MALVFDNVFVNWNDLNKFILQLKEDPDVIAPYINALHITNASSWGEWHKDTDLGEVISLCPNLRELHVNLSGSSSWLKYIPLCTKVERLVASSQMASDWAATTRDTKNKEPPLPEFDLFDLQKLPNVQKLRLEGFHVSDYSAINDPIKYKFTDISLKNCIWSFPFDFKDLDCSLSRFDATYSPQFQGFTYSERLKTLFHSPPPELKKFSLHFPTDLQKSWYWSRQESLSKKLTHLSLAGFQLPNDEFFDHLPSVLQELDIYVAPTFKQDEDTIKSMEKRIQKKYQTTKLSIRINIYTNNFE